MFILPTTKGKPYVFKAAVFLSLPFNTNSCPQQQQQQRREKKVNTIDQQKKKTIKHKCALAQWESGAGVFLQQTIKY